jgi:signal recognition particle receptor subunit beta
MALQPTDLISPRTGTPPAPSMEASSVPTVIKMVVSGGPSVGKSTFMRSLSDLDLLSMPVAPGDDSGEPQIIAAPDGGLPQHLGADGDVLDMDFGRIVLPGDVWLYLFGAPAQERYRYVWDDVAHGAVGAIILVDTDRLEDCFSSVDYCETRRIPFIIAINCFDGIARHPISSVREALAMPVEVPMFYTDARSRPAAKQALAALVELAEGRLSG